MDWIIGRVVTANAGRDKGNLLTIVAWEDPYLLLCDGAQRPLSRPKKKNPKHVSRTNIVLDSGSMTTDKALRKALSDLTR